MANITTTTIDSIPRSNKALIERHVATGKLFAAIRRANSNLGFWYSSNNGATWTDTGTGNDVATGTSALEFSFFLDKNGNPSVCYRTYVSGKDQFNIKYGAMNSTATGFTWYAGQPISSPSIPGTTLAAGGSWQGLDHITVANPGAGGAMLLIATAGAGADYPALGLDGMVSWAVALNGPTYTNKYNYFNTGGNYRNLGVVGGGQAWPSIDFKHTGDGKNISGVLDILICELSGDGSNYGRNRFTWNGNGFNSSFVFVNTSGSNPTNPAAQTKRPMRIDAQSRCLIPQLTGNDTMCVVEYDASWTSRTNRYALAHPQGTVTSAALTYDTNGNIYLFAVGTTNNVLYQSTYARGTDSWTAWAVVNATALSNPNSFSIRRGTLGSRLDSMTETGAGTFQLASQQTVITGNPFAPTWNAPTNNAAQNVSAALLLDWNFLDPDVSDTQSAFAVSRQIGAGALAYWRASDSTWQPAEVQNTSTVDQLSLASGWGAGTDANHQYKAKVWDSSSLASPYSSALTVIPSVQVNPTITAPTAAQVIASASLTVTWTVAEQTVYALQIDRDLGGANWSTEFTATGTTATSVLVPNLVNGGSYRALLQTRNNEGLASAVIQVLFSVSFTPPPTPTITFPALVAPYSYVVAVLVTNPAGSPAPSVNTIERRKGTDDTTISTLSTVVPVNGTYYDGTVRSGTDYQYRATAYTAGGALAIGAWTD